MATSERIREVAKLAIADPAELKLLVVSACGSHPTSPVKVTDLLLNMMKRAVGGDLDAMVSQHAATTVAKCGLSGAACEPPMHTPVMARYSVAWPAYNDGHEAVMMQSVSAPGMRHAAATHAYRPHACMHTPGGPLPDPRKARRDRGGAAGQGLCRIQGVYDGPGLGHHQHQGDASGNGHW